MPRTKNTYKQFISKPEVSFWIPLITAIVGVAFVWGTLTTKVQAVETDLNDTKTLLQRVIVLEEDQKNTDANIVEIKSDVKYIRQYMGQ